ncbi:MAG: glutathione transferase GstA [Gallionella sp.]
MKLYYAPGTCALASHIALEETGQPFEIDRINVPTKTTASGEDFMQINPKGYVPAVKLDDGNILTEGAVILQYIADQNPNTGLAPMPGTMERYRLQEWLNFIGSEVHKTYSPMFNKAVAEDYKVIARTLLAKRLSYVEAELADKLFLMGDTFTIADAYLFTVLRWSERVNFDLKPFPNIQSYLARIAVRPSVQAAMKAEGLIP